MLWHYRAVRKRRGPLLEYISRLKISLKIMQKGIPMSGYIRFLGLVLMTLFLVACHGGKGGSAQTAGYTHSPQPEASSPYKVKVANVYNDTPEVYEVDVIGGLWSGLDDSLKKRGMLWTPEAGGAPYTLEAHIVLFKEGDMLCRCLPCVGDAVLSVRAELMQGGKTLATIESKRKIGFGKDLTRRSAWKKVFDEVSEDIVNQAAKKL